MSSTDPIACTERSERGPAKSFDVCPPLRVVDCEVSADKASKSEDIGRINLAPHSPALDGTHLNWLIARYIEACRARLDRQRTSDGYEHKLRWFVEWWEMEGPPRDWILRPDDLAAFERYLRTTPSRLTKRRLTYNSRHCILKRLREALKWAQESGYLDRSYTKWVPHADGAPPKRKAAKISSLMQLLDAASLGRDPVRDRTIIAMLMGMGLRREELSTLDIEDVIIEADYSGYASVVGKRTTANPTGERDAAFDSATGKYIAAYLDVCGRTSGPLFIAQQRKNRLTGQGIYDMVKTTIAKVNLDKQITGPHDLRRAFATYYRRSRKDKTSADLLRRQLGHAHYSQTDKYTLLDVEDIREDIVSPLSLMDSPR